MARLIRPLAKDKSKGQNLALENKLLHQEADYKAFVWPKSTSSTTDYTTKSSKDVESKSQGAKSHDKKTKTDYLSKIRLVVMDVAHFNRRIKNLQHKHNAHPLGSDYISEELVAEQLHLRTLNNLRCTLQGFGRQELMTLLGALRKDLFHRRPNVQEFIKEAKKNKVLPSDWKNNTIIFGNHENIETLIARVLILFRRPPQNFFWQQPRTLVGQSPWGASPPGLAQANQYSRNIFSQGSPAVAIQGGHVASSYTSAPQNNGPQSMDTTR